MVKRKSIESRSRRSPSAAARVEEAARGEAGSKGADAAWFSSAAVRETIESVVIAFVLAFLFRTFEAEAFVIPTGSMAPTLMGKHKDLECPMCHYCYQVSASDKQNRDQPGVEVASNVYHATCPMCRFTMAVDPPPPNPPAKPEKKPYPSYDGDRILVAKFPFEFADPERWDVIVFKFPGDSTMNYIKRLVGKPGETLSIHDGDLWIRKPSESGQPEGDFEIARKPPNKIRAMLQPVYDNDRAPTVVGDLHWPARWSPAPGSGDNSWSNKDRSSGKVDLSSFETEGGKGEAWIRYQHRVPTPEHWRLLGMIAKKSSSSKLTAEDVAQFLSSDKPLRDVLRPLVQEAGLLADKASPDKPFYELLARLGPKTRSIDLNKPLQDSIGSQLISDFTAYNSGFGDQSERSDEGRRLVDVGYGQHWVGDLAVQFDLESKSASGKVVAELIKGGRPFRCQFDLSSGSVDLTIRGGGVEADGYHRTAVTAVKGPGQHKIVFANVDDELTLWVDEKVVAFKGPKDHDVHPRDEKSKLESEKHPDQYNSAALDDHIPTAADLSPVGIAAADGAAVKVSHIKVLRDVYYITAFNEGKRNLNPERLTDFNYQPDLGNPLNWEVDFGKNNRKPPVFINVRDPNHAGRECFFVLGDNSAQSSDGRLWTGEYLVDRELLIGKALFIYWPHGWGGSWLFFNLIPNVERMRLVR